MPEYVHCVVNLVVVVFLHCIRVVLVIRLG